MTSKTARSFLHLTLAIVFSLALSGMALAAATEKTVKGAAGAAAGAANESAKDTAKETVKETTKGSTHKAAKKSVPPSQKVNLNTAEASELARLPGVGTRTALEIITYRNRHGSINNIEELKQIKGIGEKKFDKLKDKVTVE